MLLLTVMVRRRQKKKSGHVSLLQVGRVGGPLVVVVGEVYGGSEGLQLGWISTSPACTKTTRSHPESGPVLFLSCGQGSGRSLSQWCIETAASECTVTVTSGGHAVKINVGHSQKGHEAEPRLFPSQRMLEEVVTHHVCLFVSEARCIHTGEMSQQLNRLLLYYESTTCSYDVYWR